MLLLHHLPAPNLRHANSITYGAMFHSCSDTTFQLGHDVIRSQSEIKDAIISTKKDCDAGDGVNSIVKLLSLKAATVPTLQGDQTQFEFKLIFSEITRLGKQISELRSNYFANSAGFNEDIEDLTIEYKDRIKIIEENFNMIAIQGPDAGRKNIASLKMMVDDLHNIINSRPISVRTSKEAASLMYNIDRHIRFLEKPDKGR